MTVLHDINLPELSDIVNKYLFPSINQHGKSHRSKQCRLNGFPGVGKLRRMLIQKHNTITLTLLFLFTNFNEYIIIICDNYALDSSVRIPNKYSFIILIYKPVAARVGTQSLRHQP